MNHQFDSLLQSFLLQNFKKLSRHITKMSKGKKLVLMIDEVDKISDNRVFLHFLGVLRSKFLSMQRGKDYTFHSVILAGVYDVKKSKESCKAILPLMDNSIWNDV